MRIVEFEDFMTDETFFENPWPLTLFTSMKGGRSLADLSKYLLCDESCVGFPQTRFQKNCIFE